MKRINSTRFTNTGVHFCLLLLRVGLGLMMLNHGLPKLMHFNQMAPDFFDPVNTGGHFSLILVIFAEVICAGLIILGLFTRWATIPLIIEMLVVIFMVHVDQGFARQELAAHFLLGLIILLILGPGRVSIDAITSRKR